MCDLQKLKSSFTTPHPIRTQHSPTLNSNITHLIITQKIPTKNHSYYYYSKITRQYKPPEIRPRLDQQKINLFNMGSENQVEEISRKPRFLCLHGFRTSGEILKTQIQKWPEIVRQRLDLVFVDAPFPSNGKSDVEGIFDPPYYEWFQFNKEFTTYDNFEECLEFIQECIIKHGPFDGLLGFSQGAILSAALPGLQAQGIALTKVPKVKFLIIIGGAKFRDPSWADKAYAAPIECPSLHFLGKEDFLRPYGEELLKSVIDPVIIHHPKGHTIPRIDEQALPLMLSFIDKIQKIIWEEGNELGMENSHVEPIVI